MERLPDEVLAIIFSQLNTVDKSVICASVCTKWRAVAKLTSIWRKIKFEPYFSLAKMKGFLGLDHIQNIVTTLHLTEIMGIPDIRLPNLSVLCVSSLEPNEVDRLVNFPKLDTLNIASCFVIFGVVESMYELVVKVKSFKPELKVVFDLVNFSGLGYITSLVRTEQHDLASLCTIKEVTLNVGDNTLSDAMTDLLQWFSRVFPQVALVSSCYMEALNPFLSTLTGIQFDNVSKAVAFEHLPRVCPDLAEFHVSGIQDSPEFTVTPFNQLKKLNMEVDGLEENEVLQVVSTWKNVESLALKQAKITSHLLVAVAADHPTLQEFFLSRPETEEHSDDTRQTFPSLKKLELTGSHGQALRCISAPVCKSLVYTTKVREDAEGEEIEVSEEDEIAELLLILEACPSVRNARLGVVPSSLEHLSNSSVEKLLITRSFLFDGLPRLQLIADKLPALKKVDLVVRPGPDIPLEEVADAEHRYITRENIDFVRGLAQQLRNFKELERCWVGMREDECFIFSNFKEQLAEELNVANSFNLKQGMGSALYHFFPSHVRRTLAAQGSQKFGDTV